MRVSAAARAKVWTEARRRGQRCSRGGQLRGAANPEVQPGRVIDGFKAKREDIAVLAFPCNGGPSGVRTLGLGIKSPLLCQLS